MPLVATADIVGPAAARGYGVGAFNAIQLEHLTAIVAGAEAADAPVIIQISENAVRYHGSLDPIGSAALAIARTAGVPVAVHLDHAESPELVRAAVGLGFRSVMFDASALVYSANVAATREMTEFCHDHGVWVEAELGRVGGKDGAHAPGVRTDPPEAAGYVAATGVDALGVAVGNSHAMLTTDATLDFALIRRLRAALAVPLVLHGSSGVADEDLRTAVRAGLTKINIGTRLNKEFTTGIRDYWGRHADAVDPRRYLGAGRERITAEVTWVLRLLGL